MARPARPRGGGCGAEADSLARPPRPWLAGVYAEERPGRTLSPGNEDQAGPVKISNW